MSKNSFIEGLGYIEQKNNVQNGELYNKQHANRYIKGTYNGKAYCLTDQSASALDKIVDFTRRHRKKIAIGILGAIVGGGVVMGANNVKDYLDSKSASHQITMYTDQIDYGDSNISYPTQGVMHDNMKLDEMIHRYSLLESMKALTKEEKEEKAFLGEKIKENGKNINQYSLDLIKEGLLSDGTLEKIAGRNVDKVNVNDVKLIRDTDRGDGTERFIIIIGNDQIYSAPIDSAAKNVLLSDVIEPFEKVCSNQSKINNGNGPSVDNLLETYLKCVQYNQKNLMNQINQNTLTSEEKTR